eukprot:TRINITY_DN119520_c0_g1_i1.p2 TRINITY_DN119520_c0_g1~~TRINITY_DN119520_c0_g1_i1.p2  ORF type:complete len:113 (+),score=5.24 TRINITY_DN119520_c0_g1_i1:9-347(+)
MFSAARPQAKRVQGCCLVFYGVLGLPFSVKPKDTRIHELKENQHQKQFLGLYSAEFRSHRRYLQPVCRRSARSCHFGPLLNENARRAKPRENMKPPCFVWCLVRATSQGRGY